MIDHEWNDRVNGEMKIDFSYYPKGEIEGYPEGHMTFNWNRLVYGLVDWKGYVKEYASLQKLGVILGTLCKFGEEYDRGYTEMRIKEWFTMETARLEKRKASRNKQYTPEQVKERVDYIRKVGNVGYGVFKESLDWLNDDWAMGRIDAVKALLDKECGK